MRDSFLAFGSPDISEADIQAVVEVLRSRWLGFGPRTRLFEERFAAYVGARHAIATNSCTAALHIALLAASIGPGDEVVTSAITYASTANVIVHAGATPVFADVDPATQNLTADTVRPRLSARTRAIVPVHMAGRPCDLDPLRELARDHGLLLLEDAAHATEAFYRGRKIGTIGDLTAFSFYVTKNLVTGEGGMLTTNDDAWAEKARLLRMHGITQDAWKRYSAAGFAPYETIVPGFNYSMTDLQAALGLNQLDRLEENLRVRERIFARYTEAFTSNPHLRIPPEDEQLRHARHLYTVLVDLPGTEGSAARNTLIDELKRRNIGTGVHFAPVHLHAYYRQRFGYQPGSLPQAEWVGERTLSLPLSAALSPPDVEDVIAAVQEVTGTWGR